MTISEVLIGNQDLFDLIREFKFSLNGLNHTHQDDINQEWMRQEYNSYFLPNKQVIGCFVDEKLVGYAVLKNQEGCYWLDWFFVTKKHRGKGVADLLFSASESRVQAIGQDQLYVWVHPNNQAMLRFLSKQGYDKLNLIEVTKNNNRSDTTDFFINA